MSATTEDKINLKALDSIIEKYREKQGALLTILEEAQKTNKHKFLSDNVMEYVAKKLRVSLSQVYGVATFYAFFNLKPQGEHLVVICRGTACHTRGSKDLLENTADFLGLEKNFQEGETSYTTKDNKFTIKTVACFGQCALAPVIEVDGIIYSNVTTDKLKKIINIAKGGKK
ncbi:NADH dehydrogenase [candidate division WOR-1 bacterium RIFOXYC2_FULL_37_10]|uniref:NADH dehydrogenase n=1 Tax=candidate division WOR-1 bacterium RIFOXYB2_FULL_37_13 TaxID=1802579 RepID=A0A1F4SP20_UNCSA|nr:MAG: NADH dehydrogenase [candidate division WOR-1 bacterium RIFOXYB2_FULL_37_13]OGC33692.1 MAG: NADH dehydrogenase [candidate division WOR-1 bacterium RIFOXYC2_FULL_37_10]